MHWHLHGRLHHQHIMLAASAAQWNRVKQVMWMKEQTCISLVTESAF
jgi:hypothetical protein